MISFAGFSYNLMDNLNNVSAYHASPSDLIKVLNGFYKYLQLTIDLVNTHTKRLIFINVYQ